MNEKSYSSKACNLTIYQFGPDLTIMAKTSLIWILTSCGWTSIPLEEMETDHGSGLFDGSTMVDSFGLIGSTI